MKVSIPFFLYACNVALRFMVFKRKSLSILSFHVGLNVLVFQHHDWLLSHISQCTTKCHGLYHLDPTRLLKWRKFLVCENNKSSILLHDHILWRSKRSKVIRIVLDLVSQGGCLNDESVSGFKKKRVSIDNSLENGS